MKIPSVLLAACVAASSQAPAQSDPRSMVERAIQQMGGEQTLRGLRTLRYDAIGILYNLGQSPGLGEPLPFNTRTSSIRYDFANGRMHVTTEIPGITATGPFRQRFVQSPAGGMIDNNGTLQPSPAMLPVGVRTFPPYLLLTALDPSTRLERAGAGVRMMSATDTITLFFDEQGRLSRSENVVDDPILGDRVNRTIYRGWTPAGPGGLQLPQRVDFEVNGVVTQATNLRGYSVNEPMADSLFVIPDSMVARSRALPTVVGGAAPPVAVRLDSLAPGIYHVTGGSHQSLAVVSNGAISVFEAPQSSQRMKAVLDTLASRFPGTPVRLAINSHDHWDHAGGVRAAVAARVPVMAHATSLPQLREAVRARRTLAPDGVERLRADFRPVRDSAIVGSGANMMIVYRLPTTHDDGLLVGYVPDARLLFVTDVLPNNGAGPNREVVDFAAAHGLAIERVVPSHGAIVPWARVVQLAGQN